MPSEQDRAALQALSKGQRLALFNLCTILHLTFYKPEERAAAQAIRELIRKNTLDPKRNKCEFDKTDRERKLEASPIHRPNADPK